MTRLVLLEALPTPRVNSVPSTYGPAQHSRGQRLEVAEVEQLGDLRVVLALHRRAKLLDTIANLTITVAIGVGPRVRLLLLDRRDDKHAHAGLTRATRLLALLTRSTSALTPTTLTVTDGHDGVTALDVVVVDLVERLLLLVALLGTPVLAGLDQGLREVVIRLDVLVRMVDKGDTHVLRPRNERTTDHVDRWMIEQRAPPQRRLICSTPSHLDDSNYPMPSTSGAPSTHTLFSPSSQLILRYTQFLRFYDS